MYIPQIPNKFVTLYRDIHGPTLYDEEAAREFVFALSLEERQRLLAELHKFTGAQSSGKLLPLHQLGFLYFTNCLSISLCFSLSLSWDAFVWVCIMWLSAVDRYLYTYSKWPVCLILCYFKSLKA